MLDLTNQFLSYAGGSQQPPPQKPISPFSAAAARVFTDLEQVQKLYDEWKDGGSSHQRTNFEHQIFIFWLVFFPSFCNLKIVFLFLLKLVCFLIEGYNISQFDLVL